MRFDLMFLMSSPWRRPGIIVRDHFYSSLKFSVEIFVLFFFLICFAFSVRNCEETSNRDNETESHLCLIIFHVVFCSTCNKTLYNLSQRIGRLVMIINKTPKWIFGRVNISFDNVIYFWSYIRIMHHTR